MSKRCFMKTSSRFILVVILKTKLCNNNNSINYASGLCNSNTNKKKKKNFMDKRYTKLIEPIIILVVVNRVHPIQQYQQQEMPLGTWVYYLYWIYHLRYENVNGKYIIDLYYCYMYPINLSHRIPCYHQCIYNGRHYHQTMSYY